MHKKIYVCRATILELKDTGNPDLSPVIIETEFTTIRCSELSINGPCKFITDITSDPTVYIETNSPITANGIVIE